MARKRGGERESGRGEERFCSDTKKNGVNHLVCIPSTMELYIALGYMYG
jgi:hypothetical protein